MKELQLPEGLEPINILAIGYSDEEPQSAERHEKMRMSLNELVSYEN